MATNFSLLRRVELRIRLFLFPHFIRRCPSWHCIFAIRIMACGHIVQGFMGFSLASGLLSHIVTSIFSCPRDHLRKWHRRVKFPLLSFLQPLSYTHKTVPSTDGAPHFSILKITSNGRLGLRFLSAGARFALHVRRFCDMNFPATVLASSTTVVIPELRFLVFWWTLAFPFPRLRSFPALLSLRRSLAPSPSRSSSPSSPALPPLPRPSPLVFGL